MADNSAAAAILTASLVQKGTTPATEAIIVAQYRKILSALDAFDKPAPAAAQVLTTEDGFTLTTEDGKSIGIDK